MGKKLSTTLLVIGVILVAFAIIWWTVIGPMLVKLPADINTHMDFEGTLTVYVDPATGATIPEDQAMGIPITVARDFVSLPDLYTSGTAVLEDTLVLTMMGEEAAPQITRYAVDRSSRECVDSTENWYLSPQITLDRTGYYGAIYPGGLKVGDTVSTFFNDPSQAFEVKVVEVIDDWNGLGITVLKLDATRPWTDYNPIVAKAALIDAQSLPAEIDYEQLAARLKAGGLDLGQLVTGLAAVATPEDQQAIAALMGQKFALIYKQSSADVYYIEQKTGATVGATFDRTTGMSVDTSGLMGAIGVLGNYTDDPVIGPAIKEALGNATALMGAEPTKVFNQNMSITTATQGSLAESAKEKIPLLSLAQLWIPVIIIAVGGLLLLIGAVGLALKTRTVAK